MNFNYDINLNDSTIDDIKKDESFYNYYPSKLHNFDESFEELYNYILYNDDIVFDYLYPRTDFDKKYVLNSINIWKNLGIKLHNVNVFKMFRTRNKFVIYNAGIWDSFKKVPVSSLKVNFKNIEQWEAIVSLNELDEKDYKNVIFNNIVLPKVDKRLCSTIYAHEVTHTQLNSQNGGTNSIFNEETLPVFMEFVFAQEQDNSKQTLKYVNNERLMCICKFIELLSTGNKITYKNRIDGEKYIISGLQAIELFKIYYNSKNSVKKEMINDVNKIFCGEKIIEDMIDKYQIDYKEVAKKKSLKLF